MKIELEINEYEIADMVTELIAKKVEEMADFMLTWRNGLKVRKRSNENK